MKFLKPVLVGSILAWKVVFLCLMTSLNVLEALRFKATH